MNYDQIIAQVMMAKSTSEEKRAAAEKFRKDMPQCTVSVEELTRRIRQVAPEYHFEEGSPEEVEKRIALSESAHEQIVNYALELDDADFCQMGKKVFTGKQRTQGQNLGGYIHYFMPKEYEDELRRLANIKPGDENYDKRLEDEAKLRAAVFRHASGNADKFLDELKTADTEKLIESYPKYMHLGNIADVLRYLGDHNENEEVVSHEEYRQIYDKMLPLQEIISDYLYPLQALPYPVGHMVDWKQILNMSPDQQQAIADITRDAIAPRPKDNSNLWTKHDINPDVFEELPFYSNTKRNNFIEKQIGDKSDLIAQDILGNPIDLYTVAEETMKMHHPVYLMSKEHPEQLPVLGFIHEGKFHYGEDARLTFSQVSLKKGLPKPPDASRKPTGFAGWWDSFCKNRGWEGLRTQSAKQYEAEVNAYERTCAAIKRENEENEPFIEIQNNLNKHDLTSPEKLASVREKMIRDKFGKSVEEYREDLTKQREEAKRKEEEKAKEKAELEKNKAKANAKKEAQDNYKAHRTKEIKDMLAAVKFPDKKTARKFAGNFEQLKVAVRDKQFSLYEATGMDKTERVAAALVCQMVDKLIDTDLTNMAKEETPLSKELTELLEADNIAEKLDDKIRKMQNTDALKQVAAGMNDKTLEEICPAAPNVRSAGTISDVMKQVKAAKDLLKAQETQPSLTNQTELTNQEPDITDPDLAPEQLRKKPLSKGGMGGLS